MFKLRMPSNIYFYTIVGRASRQIQAVVVEYRTVNKILMTAVDWLQHAHHFYLCTLVEFLEKLLCEHPRRFEPIFAFIFDKPNALEPTQRTQSGSKLKNHWN